MAPPDLGTSLWGLAAHLYRTRSDPASAFAELTRRTHAICGAADVQVARTLAGLRQTQWYAVMQRRYAAVRATLRAEREDDVEEVAGVVRSMYPKGCTASDFSDAVQTCAAMLSFTVTSESVDRFIKEKEEEITLHGLHELTGEELVSCMTEQFLLDALLPSDWYRTRRPAEAAEGVGRAVVRRIGLRLDPLAIVVEYVAQGGTLRHRTLPLAGTLPLSGPTGPLARRLVQSHGWLLTEAELQRLLIKLQHLAARRAEEGQERGKLQGTAGRTAATPAALASSSAAARSAPLPASLETPKKQSRKPQKADVGLLYRDPEAALDNVDLNDADDVTLQEFKDVMSEKFEANALKPGDPGYEYDRRVDVAAPTQKSAWDDDSDDE